MFVYYKYFQDINPIDRRSDYANKIILTYNSPNYILLVYNNVGIVENQIILDIANKNFNELTKSERIYIEKKALEYRGNRFLDIYHQDNIEGNFRDIQGKIRTESIDLYSGNFISKPTRQNNGLSEIESLNAYSSDAPDTFYIDFTAFDYDVIPNNCFEVLLDIGSSMNGFSIITSILNDKRDIAFVNFTNSRQLEIFAITDLNIEANKRYGFLFEIYTENNQNFFGFYQSEKHVKEPYLFKGDTPIRLNNDIDWSDEEKVGIGKQVKTISNIVLNNSNFNIKDLNGEINNFYFFSNKRKDEVWQDAQNTDRAFIYPLRERGINNSKTKEIRILDNLQRTNPQYFDDTYVNNDNIQNKTTQYVKSIDDELNKINKSINYYLLENYSLSYFTYTNDSLFYKINNDYETTRKHCRRFNIVVNKVFWTDQWYNGNNQEDYNLYYYNELDEEAYKRYCWFLSNASFFLNFYFSYDYLKKYMFYTFGIDIVQEGQATFLQTYTENNNIQGETENNNIQGQKYIYKKGDDRQYTTYSQKAVFDLIGMRIIFEIVKENENGEPLWEQLNNLETIMGIINNYYPLEKYIFTYKNRNYVYNFISKTIE